MFQQLIAAYGDSSQAASVKQLIQPKDIEFASGDMSTPAAVTVAEAVGSQGITERARGTGEVRVQFEGRIERRNYYPTEWPHGNIIQRWMYPKGFYTVAVLRTFTPDSFVNSPFFTLVRRIPKGRR